MNCYKLVIGEHITLLAEGLRGIFADAPDFEVSGIADNCETLTELIENCNPDILVIDYLLPLTKDVFDRNTDKRIKYGAEIKRKHPDLGIMVLCEMEPLYCFKECIESGVAGYIYRDASSEQIVNTARCICCGRAVLDIKIIQRVFTSYDRRKKLADKGISNLSLRELEILQLAFHGLSNKEIGNELFLSARTVQNHFRSIFNKLDVKSRTEAIHTAINNKLISVP